MEQKKSKKFADRLTEELQKILRSINRNRKAEEEIVLDGPSDEGDLATMNHNRELLEHLGEADYQRVVEIKAALTRIKDGNYGECLNCGEEIAEKRLNAVPWAPRCLLCQEGVEQEGSSSRKAFGRNFFEEPVTTD